MDNLRRVLFTQEEASFDGIELKANDLYTRPIAGLYVPISYANASRYGIMKLTFCDQYGQNRSLGTTWFTHILDYYSGSELTIPYSDTQCVDSLSIDFLYIKNQTNYTNRWNFAFFGTSVNSGISSGTSGIPLSWIFNIPGSNVIAKTNSSYLVPFDVFFDTPVYVYLPLSTVFRGVKTVNGTILNNIAVHSYTPTDGDLPIYYKPA